MSTSVDLSVELGGAPVEGRLELPQRSGGRPAGVVLLCHGLPMTGAEADGLLGPLADSIVDAGLAVATLARGSAGAPGARLAVETVDDAAALLHGLALREDLDLGNINLLGWSLGGIVAACLARRSDQVRRIVLLSPATPDVVAAGLAAESEEDLAARLGGAGVPPGYFDGLDALDPVGSLAARDRPTLIVHGAADRVVPPEASMAYYDALLAAGRRVGSVLVALGDHVFTNPSARAACLDQLLRFLVSSPQPADARP